VARHAEPIRPRLVLSRFVDERLADIEYDSPHESTADWRSENLARHSSTIAQSDSRSTRGWPNIPSYGARWPSTLR
jgi:hypothetical protein